MQEKGGEIGRMQWEQRSLIGCGVLQRGGPAQLANRKARLATGTRLKALVPRKLVKLAELVQT